MLNNFLHKQMTFLVLLACIHAWQERHNPHHFQSMPTTSETSTSGLASFLLPQPEKIPDAADWQMKRLIANLPDIIHRIMCDSEKGRKDYLKYLVDVDLVFVLDNSGSMLMCTDDNSYLKTLNLLGDKNLPVLRHHEMTFVFLSMIHVLMNCGARNIEVRLLNPVLIDGRSIRTLRVDLGNPSNIQYLYSVLLRKPYGTTPLVSNLYESISEASKPTHYIVFTDGFPYVDGEVDDSDYENTVNGLQRLLKDYFCPRIFSDFIFGKKNLTINFVACTGNRDDVAYLDKLDGMSERIDVTDDIATEIRQVVGTRGKSAAMEIFPHTISALIYKAMVGCLDRAADRQDEGGPY